jgi:septum formation protein
MVLPAPTRRLILASASQPRRRLLEAAGFAPEVVVSGVDEDGVDGAAPEKAALELAERKAAAVAAVQDRAEGGPSGPPGATALPALVLACDTILLMDGVPYGKPSSLDEARDWVTWQRNREVEVVTGHCLVDTATGRQTAGASWTTVAIGSITDEEVEAYLATGEALHAAGALTIDGYGAPFIAGLRGDHGTVVGLSLPVVRDLLTELGIPLASLWVVEP